MRIWSALRRANYPELVRWFGDSNYLAADQVPVLVLPQHPSGVMTLASAHPIYCWRLPARARAYFAIAEIGVSDLLSAAGCARLLMVVTLSINFSLGVDVQQKQLLPVAIRSPASQRGR